ncbi:MAG: FHA domain-containing protein [Verrucomicrobia bacterium]|nr:FHA domain-containing protein [Verrucomicrobiota bacterium]
MAYLEIHQGSEPRRVELTRATTVIGRTSDCGVVLASPSVSRRHARIVRKGQAFCIEDLRSHNGTVVNGRRIGQPVALADGDQITISEHRLEFRASGQPGEKSPLRLEMTDRRGETATIISTRDASCIAPPIEAGEVGAELKLRAVLDITRELGALQVEQLLPRILNSLFAIFLQADRGFILLKEAGSGQLAPKAVKNRSGPDDGVLRMSRTLMQQVFEQRRAVLLADTREVGPFDVSVSIRGFNICSVMCAPLLGRENKPLGIIQVHTEDPRRQFRPEDLEVLVSAASAAAIALENAQMREELLAQERLRCEVELARKVQLGFLPADSPRVPGYQFYASYEAAHTVGGDYYGFLELPDRRLAISLGDVSGKGLPAALLMAHLASDIRFSAISTPDPAAVVESVNRSLGDAGLMDRFVTLLFIVLDWTSHTLRLVNAGHAPPLLRHPSGQMEELGADVAGMVLNITLNPDNRYEAFSTTLEPGALLLLYTDGITDARNAAGEMFGAERLHELFRRVPNDPAQAGDLILREVRAFSAGCAQADDMTLICFGRK